MSITYSKQLYANNAVTTLTASVAPGATTLSVLDGSKFPTPGTGEFFLITVESGTNLEVIEVHGRVGGSFTGCVRGVDGTTASSFPAGANVECRVTAATLSRFARLQDRLTPISLVSDLTKPELVNGHSYLISQSDDSGSPIVAISAGPYWRFLNYPSVGLTQAVSGTPTTTSISYTGTSLATGFSAGVLLIQFTTGNNRGQCRLVSAATSSTLSWGTALPYTPTVGDTFQVYKSTSASSGSSADLTDLVAHAVRKDSDTGAAQLPVGTTAQQPVADQGKLRFNSDTGRYEGGNGTAWGSLGGATGGGTDSVFYLNGQTVNSSYSIPSGQNAMSAGPISVANGATITVPNGSVWSVI